MAKSGKQPLIYLTDAEFRMNPDPNSRVVAFVKATFNSVLCVSGMRVVLNRNNERFLSYPSKKKEGSEYYDPICFVIDRDLSAGIQAEVLERLKEFEKTLEKESKA